MPGKRLETVEYTGLTPHEAAKKLKEIVESGRPIRAIFHFDSVTWLGLEYDIVHRRWLAAAFRPGRVLGKGELVELPLSVRPVYVVGCGDFFSGFTFTGFSLGGEGKKVVVLVTGTGYVAFVSPPER
jgi:hypothetical protein